MATLALDLGLVAAARNLLHASEPCARLRSHMQRELLAIQWLEGGGSQHHDDQ